MAGLEQGGRELGEGLEGIQVGRAGKVVGILDPQQPGGKQFAKGLKRQGAFAQVKLAKAIVQAGLAMQVVEQNRVASRRVELGAKGGLNTQQAIEHPFGAEPGQVVVNVIGWGGEGGGQPAIGLAEVRELLANVGLDAVGG